MLYRYLSRGRSKRVTLQTANTWSTTLTYSLVVAWVEVRRRAVTLLQQTHTGTKGTSSNRQ